MEIKHYINSFITVKSKKTVVTCDPWIGNTDENAWLSYPIFKGVNNIINNDNPNFIYISHLHCDHLDPKTLIKYNKKKITLIIKDFKNKRFKNKLIKLGFIKIIELKALKPYNLSSDLKVCIIPQFSSNTSSLEENINYDLDTSIIFYCKNTNKLFFNNVDNPLSYEDMKFLKSFIYKSFKKEVDVFCHLVGAASEYPQCFLNINRMKQKEKVIDQSLDKVKSFIDLFSPSVFFPSGGTYIIAGKYYSLNKFIAQPNFSQIKKKFQNDNTKIVNLEGGSKLTLHNLNKNFFTIDYIKPEPRDRKIKTIYASAQKKYFYEKKFNFNLSIIDELFNKSIINYNSKLNTLNIKSSWKIEFYIYNNLYLKNNGNINSKKSNFIKKYSLSYSQNLNRKTKLICHLDFSLFYGLLTKKYAWNAPLSGSVVMFERKPNRFDPNTTFSLNFLNN